MNRGKYSPRHRASLWREIVENANGCKRVQCDCFVFHRHCGFLCPRSALRRWTAKSSDFWKTCGCFSHAIFKLLLFALQAESLLWRIPSGAWVTDVSTAPSCSLTAQGTREEEEKKKSNFFFYFHYYYFFSKLRAVTLALPVVKASLTGHRILIMSNIIFTITLKSRQGLIISSDSIGRPLAAWGTIDLSGRAVQLEESKIKVQTR